jgi:hypothetical protein
VEPTGLADCPGAGNTAAVMNARGADNDCSTGKIIGIAGVTVE